MKLFPTSASEKIGLQTVLGRLAELVENDAAREVVRKASFLTDRVEIETALHTVAELQQCLRFDDPLPLKSIALPEDLLRRGRPEGAALGVDDFLGIRAVADSGKRTRAYFDRRSDKYPAIVDITGTMRTTPALSGTINEVLDDDGNIRDDASALLGRIRRDLLSSRGKLRSEVVAALKKVSSLGFAADDQPTLRAGRMVIPVRAEARRKIAGFVHDVSASGQTVYVEPTECLDLNNRIRELETAEIRELVAIRRALTDRVRDQLPNITHDATLLLKLDVIRAKARLANEMNACVPDLNSRGLMQLVSARNPELVIVFRSQDRDVVPMDLTLGDSFRTLVISGPNAGGKSVAMKTVGLCAAMLSLGIPIPVDERSSVCLFTSIMVDIGDEQSVEDDLSTYTSHLRNLNVILREATPSSLVLLDEFGAGTDPDEGAGIAQAILERLTVAGAFTIATTHHGALKVFAHSSDGTANGSMQFDLESLSPTFRFVEHVPGSSYASEIAVRVGIPEDVIGRARELIGAGSVRLEQLILDLEERNARLSSELDASARAAAEAEKGRERLLNRIEGLQEGRDEIKAQALIEAEAILEGARSHVERAVREIRESQADKQTTKRARSTIEEATTSVQKSISRLKVRKKSRKKAKQQIRSQMEGVDHSVSLREGDTVVLDDGETTGEVMEIAGKDVRVAFSGMQMRVAADRLRRVAKESPTPRGGHSRASANVVMSARISVDIRGFRVDEAIFEIQRFLDEAAASGLNRLEIIHGKGTGALRNAVDEYIQTRDDVLRRQDAPWNEGGPGVSIVIMKAG